MISSLVKSLSETFSNSCCIKKAFLIFFLAIPVFKTEAQQNLFNIPSGDITNPNKAFYQHQLNLYENKVESKAHFVYGLGKGWDAGVNLVGKGVYFSPKWRVLHNDNPNKGSVYPILMGTLQKQVRLSERWDVNAGAQVGWNLSQKVKNKELNHFTYLIGTYHFLQHSRIVAGFYNTNKMFVGEGRTYGVMAGFELKLSKNLYLMGDWVSGDNDASVMVLGGMVNVSKRVQVCAGWQIPNPNASKPMGLVLELNILGWDLH